MWHMLVVLRRNLQNIKKSPRVADENMFGGVNHDGAAMQDFMDGNHHGSWNGLSVICSVIRAPLSLVSCFSEPNVNDGDEFWVSSEFTQISELNHLMVNDSLRYAILM